MEAGISRDGHEGPGVSESRGRQERPTTPSFGACGSRGTWD